MGDSNLALVDLFVDMTLNSKSNLSATVSNQFIRTSGTNHFQADSGAGGVFGDA